MMAQCAYPVCEDEGEYKCVVCRKSFCAFHIYQPGGGYICKIDFDEPAFVDPHRSPNYIAEFENILRKWLSGKKRR